MKHLPLVVVALALAGPLAAADAQGPAAVIEVDCFSGAYHVTAAGPPGTHWELYVGSQLVDEHDGPTYSHTGFGAWGKSIRLYANGHLVAEYNGPWCI